jgi:hypothetical protein
MRINQGNSSFAVTAGSLQWSMHPFIIIVLAVLIGCGKPSGQADIQPGTVDARTTLKALIFPEIPTDVTHIEGGAETWQGYSAYLRFQASDVTISRLLGLGYRPTAFPWHSEKVGLVRPLHFSGGWRPRQINGTESFETNVKNEWTHSGTHYVVIDRTNKVVYFIGIGS